MVKKTRKRKAKQALCTSLPRARKRPRGRNKFDDNKPVRFNFRELVRINRGTDAPAVEVAAFWPGASGLTRLDRFAATYEQWRLISCKYHMTPQVGTTISGSYVAAIDLDVSDYPSTYESVYSTTPRVVGAVWQARELSVPVQRAMKSKWHMTAHGSPVGFTASHSLILAHSSATSAGAANYPIIEVSYTVELANPTAAWSAQFYTFAGSSWNGPDGKVITDAKFAPQAAYSFEASGPSSWWNTFKTKLEDVVYLINQSVGSNIRATGTLYSNVESIALGTAAAGALLAIRGPRRP